VPLQPPEAVQVDVRSALHRSRDDPPGATLVRLAKKLTLGPPVVELPLPPVDPPPPEEAACTVTEALACACPPVPVHERA
jgi:hypothetical protein